MTTEEDNKTDYFFQTTINKFDREGNRIDKKAFTEAKWLAMSNMFHQIEDEATKRGVQEHEYTVKHSMDDTDTHLTIFATVSKFPPLCLKLSGADAMKLNVGETITVLKIDRVNQVVVFEDK